MMLTESVTIFVSVFSTVLVYKTISFVRNRIRIFPFTYVVDDLRAYPYTCVCSRLDDRRDLKLSFRDTLSSSRGGGRNILRRDRVRKGHLRTSSGI